MISLYYGLFVFFHKIHAPCLCLFASFVFLSPQLALAGEKKPFSRLDVSMLILCVGDRRTNGGTYRSTPTQRKVTPSTNPWSRIPTHLLGTPAMGGLGQARAYSSDSKDDIPDIGLGFQSLGSLFPPPPAPGRYSQPKERRAEEEAMSTKREEQASGEVSQQDKAPVPGRYSQPREKKSEEEAVSSAVDEQQASREDSHRETTPKAPFFGSAAPEQSHTPEQLGTPEQASEPAADGFRLRKVNKTYEWTEGRWDAHLSGKLHARELARIQKFNSQAKSQDSAESSGGLSTRRERRATQTTKKPVAARADKAVGKTSRKSAPNPVARKGHQAPFPAEPQPSKDAWGLSQVDETTTSPPNPSSASEEPSKTAPATTPSASHLHRRLTHVRPSGEAHMVDVGAKPATKRTAIAIAHIRVSAEVYKQIEENSNKKGDVLGIARVAGIMAAKRTSDIIPLCHPLALTKAEVDVYLVPVHHVSPVFPSAARGRLVVVQALVETLGPTGVEMEALTAVQGAALTVFDMCKALDKTMAIEGAKVVYKAGGRSGTLVDVKWKNEVGREKFGPEGLKEGLGNGDLLVRGRLNERSPGIAGTHA